VLVIQTVAQEKSGVILSAAPKKVDTSARYLFYLHGRIVEQGRRPVSPQYGPYEYDQILETFKAKGFVVISEQRRAGTDVEQYAGKVADQVRQLLKAGVPPRNITVVGASQGSFIAMLASTYLKNRDVNFVLMAGCSAEARFIEIVDLHGNVLSIYERTDGAGSCEKYRVDATGLAKYQETELQTGMRHGFIYRPMTEWIEPTISWARGL
jgi:pimeloyl-ACP methyl ester carboxylesterase